MEYIITLCNHFQEILTVILLLFFIYYLVNIGNKYVDINKRFIIKKRKIAITLMIVISIGIIYSLINNKNLISEMILLVFYSILLSYVLNPIVNYLERKGLKRNFGIIILYLTVLTIFILMVVTIIPELARESQTLVELIPIYVDDMYEWFNGFYFKYIKNIENLPKEFNGLTEIILEKLGRIEFHILKFLKRNTDNVISKMKDSLKLFLVPILSYYFLKDKEYFKKKIYENIPFKYKAYVLKLSKEIDTSLLNFLKGQIITSIIVGVLSMIGLFFLNIKFAILIGTTIALFEIIPYLGPFVGITLAVIFGLTDSLSKAFWGVITLLVIQQIENNIIAPRIVGENVGLHPVIVIVAAIIGGGYFGIIGMILAIPVTSVVKIVWIFSLDYISKIKL